MDRLPSTQVSSLAEILKQAFSNVPLPESVKTAINTTPSPKVAEKKEALDTTQTYNTLEVCQLIREIKQKLGQLERLLSPNSPAPANHTTEKPERITDGVFDGLNMIDAEGDTYPVPENYVSKSKLVEGDLLQAMIMPGGRVIFKQLERVERKLTTGYLKEESGQFACQTEGGSYRILRASVTFWRVAPGDKLIISVPKNGMSTWAAVEKKE